MLDQFLTWLYNQRLTDPEIRIEISDRIFTFYREQSNLFVQIPPEYRDEEQFMIFTQIILVIIACLRTI